jgi:uncharacterized protein
METFSVVHVPERQRYDLMHDGRAVGHLDARVQGGTVIMPYVEVDHMLRGRNLGALLVKRALDDVRSKGLKVVALCPFVAGVLRAYPAPAGQPQA